MGLAAVDTMVWYGKVWYNRMVWYGMACGLCLALALFVL